jgi:prevent-host-death family protein
LVVLKAFCSVKTFDLVWCGYSVVNITTFLRGWCAMEKTVSAAEANRKFSQLLQDVRRGRSYVVTSHGRPVAKLSPIRDEENAGVSGREALLARLRDQPATKTGPWTRDELYQDVP